jgi:predicted RNA-binding protein with PUA-like domain
VGSAGREGRQGRGLDRRAQPQRQTVPDEDEEGRARVLYHSNEGKEIVGIGEIIREHYPDPSDASGKFVAVDIKADKPLKTPVTLVTIKAEPSLSEMALLKQSRLSVQPVTAAEWKIICKMGGV